MLHIKHWPRWNRELQIDTNELCQQFGVELVLGEMDVSPDVFATVDCRDQSTGEESDKMAKQKVCDRMREFLACITVDTHGLFLTDGIDFDGTVHHTERLILRKLSYNSIQTSVHPTQMSNRFCTVDTSMGANMESSVVEVQEEQEGWVCGADAEGSEGRGVGCGADAEGSEGRGVGCGAGAEGSEGQGVGCGAGAEGSEGQRVGCGAGAEGSEGQGVGCGADAEESGYGVYRVEDREGGSGHVGEGGTGDDRVDGHKEGCRQGVDREQQLGCDSLSVHTMEDIEEWEVSGECCKWSIDPNDDTTPEWLRPPPPLMHIPPHTNIINDNGVVLETLQGGLSPQLLIHIGKQRMSVLTTSNKKMVVYFRSGMLHVGHFCLLVGSFDIAKCTYVSTTLTIVGKFAQRGGVSNMHSKAKTKFERR